MEIAVFWLGFALATGFVAWLQGRNIPGWFVGGLVFGVFAFIVITQLPLYITLKNERRARAAQALKASCPRCAETTQLGEIHCNYCGHLFG
jgi:hypothetical protein